MHLSTRDLTGISISAVIIAICSWISIPSAIPFTMQTFAIFSVLGVLGGKKGSLAIAVYLLMGAIGLPVFAGFAGGPSMLFGATGGYLLGFLLSGVVYWLLITKNSDPLWKKAVAMVIGCILYFVFGTIWFKFFYTRNTGAIGWGTALSWCVFPFLLPDAAKIALALTITKTVGKRLHWD